jgi:hypothetical protein
MATPSANQPPALRFLDRNGQQPPECGRGKGLRDIAARTHSKASARPELYLALHQFPLPYLRNDWICPFDYAQGTAIPLRTCTLSTPPLSIHEQREPKGDVRHHIWSLLRHALRRR